MGKNKNKKRRQHETSPSSTPSKLESNKKPNSSSTDPNQSQQQSKHPTFSSYLDIPDLHPKLKMLCEIIATTPSLTIDKVLDDTSIRVSTKDVEDVLKLSYGYAGPAVKFFRWAGFQLNDKHSPYAWNLVVDLLGKNCLFDAMWDAIKSMKKENLLSLATFASVFSSYVIVNHVREAIMTFEVMDQYGCPRNILALNSLVSAICRDGKVVQAKDFLNSMKDRIRPDADTYAILLEGWENEKDVDNARQTFADMVMDVGWDPKNEPAYDSFLITLLKGPDGLKESLSFFQAMKDRKCYPGIKFFKVALAECLMKCDKRVAEGLWSNLVGKSGCKPDTELYNMMIQLHCSLNEIDLAQMLLDEMVYNGAFPDSETYNIYFQFLIKNRTIKEASMIFNEMVKNEFVPTLPNCNSAVRVILEDGDPYIAIKIWKCMIENFKTNELEETGNMLVVFLRDINRVPEAVKYAEDMIEKGIKLNSSTLSKLKQSLTKLGKIPVYDELLKKWKFRSNV